MSTTTRCWRCGAELAPNAESCASCGSEQRVAADPAQPVSDAASKYDFELLERVRKATAGDYEILSVLGRGGMAVVYLAHSIPLDRRVALKVMLPGLFYEVGMPERFLREAQTAARLDHPGIVVIHRVVERQDLLYFEMRYVEGCSLDRVIRRLGALPVGAVALILSQVADALEYAHQRGVVHRDIKPSNVMIDLRGNAIVTDFGIARAAGSTSVTSSGVAIGTPAYMSPEQVVAENKVTGLSDQYSLGIMAFELLTGSVPFRGTPVEVGMAHVATTPPALQSVRPDCPDELAAAVDRMLLKKPEDRFPDLNEVSAIADRAGAGTLWHARSVLSESSRAAHTESARSVPITPLSPLPASLRGLTEKPRAARSSAAQPGEVGQAARPAAAGRVRRRLVAGVGALLITATAGGLVVWSANRQQGSPKNGVASQPLADSAVVASPPPPTPSETTRASGSSGKASIAAGTSDRGVERAADRRRAVPQAPVATPKDSGSTGGGAVADSAVVPVAVPEAPKPAPVILVGSRVPDAYVYINGDPKGRPLRLRRYVVTPGTVRVTIAQEGCVPWDTLVTVQNGDSLAIGLRNPSCK